MLANVICRSFMLAFAMCAIMGCKGRDPFAVVVGERNGLAIQAAIDAVAANGGGMVVLRAGEYPSKPIRLKSGVELHLEKGAVIKGPDNPLDYVSSPSEDSLGRPGLLQAFDVNDVAITGEGTVEINGSSFFDTSAADLWGQFFHPYSGPRPEMLQMSRCRGVRISGVTFLNSPLWTIRLTLCEDVDIDGIKVINDLRFINADGMDVDGCRHVRVRNSQFVTGDDSLILRAIPDSALGHEVVTEDVLFENCTLESACQAIRIGCPSDEVIRNVVFRNIRAKGRNGIFMENPLHYLSDGDSGRLDVCGIDFDGFTGDFYQCALCISVAPGIAIRGIRDVSFRNFNVRSAKPLCFVGNVKSRIERIHRENFMLNGTRLPDGDFVADCTNDEPLKNGKRPRLHITRPRPDLPNLPEQKRSY